MSSRLPNKLVNEVLARAVTAKPGRYRCAGYGRKPHGSFERPEIAIDHIVPEHDGGAVRDPANLQVLCVDCHKRKTAHEASIRARAGLSDGSTGRNLALAM